jgi:hypothetical protein
MFQPQGYACSPWVQIAGIVGRLSVSRLFRKHNVDGAMPDTSVTGAAHRKTRMLPFANPAPKPRSLFNNFWKLAVTTRVDASRFGNQNAIRIKLKRWKVEERS